MWKDLSIKEKAALINIGVNNGLYDLEDIKSSYNKYAEGGHLDDDEIVLPAVNLGEVKIPIVEGTDEVDTPIVMPKPKDTYSPVPLTNKTKEALDDYINSMNLEDMQNHINSLKSDYIRGSDVNEQDLDSIKEALKTVAYSPMNENSYFTNYAKFGGLLNTEANKYETGGYKPSSRIKNQTTKWEGSTMKVNRSFEDEARDFNYSLPKGATSKLSQSQLDGLYSYSYNVGAGRFRQRVKPVLTKYLNGEATIQDVQKSMWASKDSQLRGLAKRRNVERSMFGGNYQSPLRDNLVTQNLIQSLPSVYDYKPPIIPQIEYTPDPSIIDNLTEEYTGIPEIMDRPVDVNPADNFLKVYNLLNNIRR